MSNRPPIPPMVTPDDNNMQAETRTHMLVALAGPPNVGKSTIFNLLTGSRQHVGNWPGKTVERKEGELYFDGVRIHVVDLPGTYSLTSHTPEEQIARDFLIRERPDVVVAVVNAAALERGLYLVSELLLLDLPVVVALNMMDVADATGLKIEPEVMQAACGVPIVPMSAAKRTGFTELLRTALRIARDRSGFKPRPPQVRDDHRHVYELVRSVIAGHGAGTYPVEWLTFKLMEGDPEAVAHLQRTLPGAEWHRLSELLRAHDDAQVAVASGRYEWIARMIRAAVVRPQITRLGISERIDAWVTHPVLGLLILGLVLGSVFLITNLVGVPVQQYLERHVLAGISTFIVRQLEGAPDWVRGLLLDGVLAGAGTVVSFLPVLMVFFGALAVLEDVGYMARAAFVTDRFMHLLGLHGKSFLPLMLGFGCNVPAVLGTRVIEAGRSRLLTILLAPFVPCTARLAVVSVLAPVYFGVWAPLVATGIVAGSLLMLVGVGMLLNRVMPGQRTALIMELPLYQAPNWRTVALSVWQQSLAFLRKAATIIVLASILVWGLTAFPGPDPESSYLARLGQTVEPAWRVLGFDWRLVVAALTSVIAKENAVASLAVLLGASESGLTNAVRSEYGPAQLLAFMSVIVLFIPCVPTLVTVRRESGSWLWSALSAGLMLGVSVVVGAILFHVARVVTGGN